MCSAPVDDKNTVRFGIACCQHDSILCIPGTKPFIQHKKIRRQAEHPAATAAASRMLRVQRNDMRKANQGKSGVQKNQPSGGTSRREAAASRLSGALWSICNTFREKLHCSVASFFECVCYKYSTFW